MVDDTDLFSMAAAAAAPAAAAGSAGARASQGETPGRVTAHLRHPTDLNGFRAEARRLLAAGIGPHRVDWLAGAEDDAHGGERPLWQGAAGEERGSGKDAQEVAQEVAQEGAQEGAQEARQSPQDIGPEPERSNGAGEHREAPPAPRVPPAFLALCQRVVLHRDPARWELLYRLLWRLQHEPGLRHDLTDPDWLHARQLARDVQRDLHKMKAFVRFRELPGAAEDGGPLFIAWFEPAHRIVQAVGPFFARRFANMRWAILTPDISLHWDGRTLHTGPAARKDDVPADDAVQGLWLTYYEHIFNPARLNLRALAREMPRRYWADLPEARLIGPLAAQAARRSDIMVRQAPTEPRRGMRRMVPASAAEADDAAAGPRAGMPAEPSPAHATAAHAPPAGRPAPSLDTLRQQAARCRDCPLWEPATQTVFGEGAAPARLMLVGEQPGDQEDVRGRPFVGPAGKLLDRALDELGLDRDALYVTNAVKHFKYELRGTRRIHKTPTQREAAACLHWLESEIATVAPQAIVALGATAARSLLGRAVSVTAERGQWLTRPDGRPVLITLHPSALLRLPHEERDAAYARWLEDLQRAVQPTTRA